MANQTLELNIYSAKDLENVNLITKMDVYAVAWINGDDSQKNHKEKTDIDRTGASEPTWNHTVKFPVDKRLLHEGRLTLFVKVVCDRLFGGRDLGEVQVPILELLHGNGNGMRFVTYQMKTPGGKGQGSLTFSYRFNTPSFNPDLQNPSDSLSIKPDFQESPVYQNPINFKPDLPVHQNPIDTPPDFPLSAAYPPREFPPPPTYPPRDFPATAYPPATTYPPRDFPATTYPATSEAGFYPPISSIGYPPSSPPYPYPPSSSGGANFYPQPTYGGSPPHYPPVYPPPPPGHSFHQVQQSQSFHGYAHTQQVYGYQQSSSGYGYSCPSTQQPPKKNSKPGLGFAMGARVLGGALGGLLLGDLVSDLGFDF